MKKNLIVLRYLYFEKLTARIKILKLIYPKQALATKSFNYKYFP